MKVHILWKKSGLATLIEAHTLYIVQFMGEM